MRNSAIEMHSKFRYIFSFLFLSVLTFGAFAQKTKQYTESSVLFNHAKMLYIKQLYVPAIKEFQHFLDTKPGSNFEYEANACIGLSRLKLEKANAARDLINFVKEEPEHKLNTEITYELGLYYFNTGKYSRAAKYLESISENDVTKAQREELIFKKGYSYFNTEEFEKAKTEFRKIMNGDGKYAIEASYYYGYQCYILNDYACALATFQKIGDKGPKTMKLYIAQIYYGQEEYEKAFDAIKGLDIPNQTDEIELLTGKIQYKLGNINVALSHFDKFKGDVPLLQPDEIYQFAFANYAANKLQKSSDYFILIANQENAIGQASNYHLGVNDVKSNKKDRALNAFAEAKRKNYDKKISELAAFNYAKLAAELQQNNTAINAIKEFLDKYPRSEYADEAKSIMAEVFLSTKNYKAAIEVLEQINTLNNTAKTAYQELTFHRGEELYLNKQYQDAEIFFIKSVKYPKDPTLEALAYFWRAQIAFKVDDYAESTSLMNRFLSNSGSDKSNLKGYGYYSMGYNYYKQDNYSKAQNYFASYKKAETFNPANKSIYLDNTLRLADCYFLNRQYNEAVKEYDFIIQKDYKNSDYAIFQKGMLYGLQERSSEKINTLKLIQKDFPKSIYIDDALYQIAREYLALENYTMAESIFKMIISQHDYSPYLADCYLKLGLIYNNRSKEDVALGYFKTVVERFPKTSSAKEALAFIEIIYTNQGKPEEYFEYVKNVPDADVRVSYQDSVIYQSALMKYGKGDCPNAITNFKSYISKFGNSGYFIVPAHYYKAECEYFNDKQAEAIKSYQFVVSQSTNEFTEKSLIRLSSYYVKQNNCEEALTYFAQLEPVASSKSVFISAIMGAMRCSYKMKDYEMAKKKAIELLPIENVPKEDLVEANMVLGRIQLKDNNLRTAKSHFDYVISESRNELTAEALFQRATIYFQQNDLEASRTDILKLNDDFSAYEFWVVKGFILLSDIYLKENDYFQAKATLQSIIDNYEKEDDGLLDICRLKLKEIEQLENPKKKLIEDEE